MLTGFLSVQATSSRRLREESAMDLYSYREWAQMCHFTGHEETVQALAEHRSEINVAQEQAEKPAGMDGAEPDGMKMGGMTLG